MRWDVKLLRVRWYVELLRVRRCYLREEAGLGVAALADADRLVFKLKAFGGAPAIVVLLRTTNP